MAGGTLPDRNAQSPNWELRIWLLAARAAIRLRPLVAGKGARHFWLTLAMIAAGVVLHYVNFLPSSVSEDSPLHLARPNMNRILFMVPVIYASFIFGTRGGIVTLATVTLLMLPRALFNSSSPTDAVLEVFCIALVSSLIIQWFGGQHRQKEHRLEILGRLELARKELASQVEIIKKNERRLAAINEICSVVAQSLAVPHILQRVLDKVVEEMGVAAAMLFLWNRATQRLELVAHRGVSEGLASAVATLKLGEGFNGRVARYGEPMVVENSLEDPSLSIPELIGEGIQSQLIVPLRSKGTTIGTLCVAQRTSRPFSPDDRELLAAIGSQVGIAIENARLYHEALVSEEKYRDLFENATVAIFVQDLEGKITAANKACTGLTGYPLRELIDTSVSSLFPSEAVAILARVQQDLLWGEGSAQPYDVRLIRSDGAESILSMTTRLVCENGQPRGFQHIAIDVTERRRMRDTLNYYMRQVLTAQEEERKRIARELHDETAQSLLLTLQRLDRLTYKTGQEAAGLTETDLEELRAVLLQTLANVRRLTRDLRPQILDDLGLVAAVEWLAEDTERQCGIKTTVEVLGSPPSMTPETQLLLFRIAQEALSNVRRHSGASAARAVLQFADGRARISIEDNGRGFRMPGRLSDLAGDGKLGILGMSERARLAGGFISIEAEPGKGTRVVAEIGV